MNSIIRYSPILPLVMFAAQPATARDPCPESLVQQLQNDAPFCDLLDEGTLTSDLGNSDAIYRLYRRVSKREEPPGPLYDAPPCNQVAVTLSLAGDPEPFWSRYYWLENAWIETPALVTDALRRVLGGAWTLRWDRSLVEDHVFMPTAGRTWTEIGAAQLDQKNGDGWLRP